MRRKWSIFRSKVLSSKSNKKKPGDVRPEHREQKVKELDTMTFSNGEKVVLDGVAFSSLYPFSGGIRNGSRSSQNLRASRSAHSLAVELRNASRASHRTEESDFNSNSGYSVSQSDENDGPYTITVQPNSPTSPTKSPTPVRQFSISLPDIPGPSNYNTRGRPRLGKIELRKIGSPKEVASPEQIDIESLHIPTRPTSPRSASLTRYMSNTRITPVMPEATPRYIKKPRLKKDYTSMTIEPLTISFERPHPPHGWIKCIHVEGARYFRHSTKRISTDADVYNPNILNQLEEDISFIEKWISTNGISLPPKHEVDLVIDVFHDENKDLVTTYYYVHHPSRSIFFLDQYEADNMASWYEIQGCKTESHLRHEIHAQYWYFVQLYPHALDELTKDMIFELRGVILHFIGDFMTSVTSTAPFALDELYKVLKLTNSLEKNIDSEDLGSKSLFARLMYIIVHSRFLDFHGEPHSRVERTFSVYGLQVHSKTLLIKSLSLFLFFAPDFHLRTLQNMWVDEIMHKSVWRDMMKKMNDEWQEIILFATVMLNANVAFLAIQSVDIDQDPYRSPAQIASYLSVVASIGSIIMGLLLVRQNRTKNRESVDEVQNFLARIHHPRLGLETLAILFSLPYALLMWGVVGFLAAFAFVFFQDASNATRSLVGSFCFVVLILIAWCVWTMWEDHESLQSEEVVYPAENNSMPENNDRSSISIKSVSSAHSIQRTKITPSMILSKLSALFSPRRGSCDSDKTAVETNV